jgi:hypothetical protein
MKCNIRQGLRSLRHLSRRLTVRADDSHAAAVPVSEEIPDFSRTSPGCQAQVRFYALYRIKPHAPLVVRFPVNSFEF